MSRSAGGPCMSNYSEAGLTCGVCGQLNDEPRILPCLHTFCTRCIDGLDSIATPVKKSDDEVEQPQQSLQQKLNSLGSKVSSNKDSAASGYESDKSPTFSLEKRLRKSVFPEVAAATAASRKIQCPTCYLVLDIPIDGGASHLPLHYVLLNKVHQASLNGSLGHSSPIVDDLMSVAERTLCELCTGDVKSIVWCPQCSLSLCAFCSEAHKRQRRTEGHRTRPLDEAIRAGLLSVGHQTQHRRRRPVCAVHPMEELCLFCRQCNVTACHECVLTSAGAHFGHPHCPVAEVAQSKVAELRSLEEKTPPKMDAIRHGLSIIRATSKRIEDREVQVANEIDVHFEGYFKALEEHRRDLKAKVVKACERKQRILKLQSGPLTEALENLETSYEFVKQLLADGTDVEIVTLLSRVGRRIRDLVLDKHRLEPRIDHFLQFVADEPADDLVAGFRVGGIITTQRIAPHMCIIKGTGGGPLAKQGRLVEMLLMTKDIEGQLMRRGGANLKATFINKDFPDRATPVKVTDRKNGTYQLTFKPVTVGLFWLSVKIEDKNVQGSPYPIQVKGALRPHTGVYHCCSFCSSSGSKEAKCGCRGTMPGGFKGCGHGHEGHPGKEHWSCCGLIDKGPGCTRPMGKILEITI